MSERASSEAMGPVEFAVLEFPHSSFDGRIAAELADLVDRGIVSIIDLLMVGKDTNGDLRVIELADAESGIAERFNDLDGEVLWLLSDQDVAAAAATLRPGTVGVLIVWESVWARSLKNAIGQSGGRLVIHDRLDADEVAAAIENIDWSLRC